MALPIFNFDPEDDEQPPPEDWISLDEGDGPGVRQHGGRTEGRGNGQYANVDSDGDGVDDYHDDPDNTIERIGEAATGFGPVEGITGVETPEVGGIPFDQAAGSFLIGGPAGLYAADAAFNGDIFGDGEGSDNDGDGDVDRADALIDERQKRLDDARAQRQQNIDDFYGEAGPAFDAAADRADAYDDGLARQMLVEYSQNYDPLEANDYVGDAKSQAAKAKADQRSINAQYGALDKLEGWTDPSVTAKERFLMETARRAEERDRKSAMDAALRDMEARGVRSGGAEIGALLGAQQTTSENRMLQDLGTMAGASERALLATQQYGDLAGDIRGQSFNESFSRGNAADQMSQFNKRLRTDYNQWEDQYRQRERDAGWDRTQDFQAAGRDTVDRQYGRQKDRYDIGRDELGFRDNASRDDQDADVDMLRIQLGKEAADEAAAALKEPEGFDPLDPSTWDQWSPGK